MGHTSDNFLISLCTVTAIVTILKLSSIILSLLLTVSYHSTTLSLVKKNIYGTGVCISVDEYFLKYYFSDIFHVY